MQTYIYYIMHIRYIYTVYTTNPQKGAAFPHQQSSQRNPCQNKSLCCIDTWRCSHGSKPIGLLVTLKTQEMHP